ncbi:flagellar assembly protein FliH [Shewanella waksmanii]|uniref:flagellar assembly protein FliH n=1 Tax=Shewanella waksmanii TaxID=213783 RepID=UPI0037351497
MTRNPNNKWRLNSQLARRHRFAPLHTSDTNEAQEASWDDYQQAYDKGYEEGLNNGHREGFASGKEDGLQAGHAAGFNQGRAEGEQSGRTNIDQQLNELITPLSALKDLLEEGYSQQINEQQSLILDLVRRVSQQVIRCELTLQPQQILTLIEETLAALPDNQGQVAIHLEPTAVKQLTNLAADKVADWHLVADNDISAGGCRIVTEHTDADASVETRLNACMDQVQAKLAQANE